MAAKDSSKDKNGKTYGSGRTRTWATMVYPESAPKGWQSILQDQHIGALISPIHDSDKNPTGEDKKAHYHVLVNFDSVKTNTQAKEIFDLIGGVGCEKVASLRQYARYLCHLDNPEKARYNEDDVIALGGMNYLEIIEIPSDKYNTINEMMDFCDINQVYSYAQLVRYSRKYKQKWFRALCDNSSYIMREYLNSLLWEHSNTNLICPDEELKEIDNSSGEVVNVVDHGKDE